MHATFVARTKREIEQLQKEVKQLEKDLVSTGSTRTADDVQRELDEISMKMYDPIRPTVSCSDRYVKSILQEGFGSRKDHCND